MKTQIKTDKAQSAPALLSQAIVSGDFIFTAGFIHVTADGTMVEGTTEEMFAQVMRNIEEVLKAADSNLEQIVKVTLYVTDIAMLADINKIYPTYFTEPFPAREAICVSTLPLGAKIEISVVAEKIKS